MPGRAPLWAPWRMDYIERPVGGDACIFCDPDRATPDRERLILHRGPRALVMLNRFPYSVGHLMVAPHAHVPRLAELDAETRSELIDLVSASSALLEQKLRCEGLNLGANLGRVAGAGFADHLHFHVVPRWGGDTNFMTVVGELRVIPQHLERTFDALAPAFAAWGSP